MDATIVSGKHDIFFSCVEGCSEPIMITDAAGTLIYVNPAWSKTYGYSSQEAVGNTPRILRSEFQTEDFYKEMWTQILDPAIGSWRGEMVNKAKDGRLVTVLLTIAPYKSSADSKAPIQGYMGIAVDLTAQKEIEMKSLQQDRLASLGMVASGLAHEVGTPLGVIRGRAEFLMMQTESNDGLKKGLEVIVSQIDRISQLIRSILRASRSSEDVIVMPVEIEPLAQEIVTLMQQAARKLGIELSLDMTPGLIAMADANHLHQVMLNLVVNSIHAIEKQKELGASSGHSITIFGRAQGECIEISVKDTGCGIAPEHMIKLFRPFFTTKDIGKGTGLGLAISSRLINEMNGKITATSEGVGRGASFVISLPRHN